MAQDNSHPLIDMITARAEAFLQDDHPSSLAIEHAITDAAMPTAHGQWLGTRSRVTRVATGGTGVTTVARVWAWQDLAPRPATPAGRAALADYRAQLRDRVLEQLRAAGPDATWSVEVTEWNPDVHGALGLWTSDEATQTDARDEWHRIRDSISPTPAYPVVPRGQTDPSVREELWGLARDLFVPVAVFGVGVLVVPPALELIGTMLTARMASRRAARRRIERRPAA